MKAEWTIACALALAVTAACSDEKVVDVSQSTGGSGGGGSGGMDGGQAGSGGVAGGAAGSGGSAGSDAGMAPGVLLAALTDFTSNTEVTSIDLATHTVLGSAMVADGDAVPAAGAGTGFVLARTLSQVLTLGANGAIADTIDVGRTAVGLAGTSPTNPSSLAAVSASKAYVTLYDANRVAVMDLGPAAVASNIDLASYLGSGDGDGAVDATAAVYDSATQRVYFVLERVDRTTIAAPAYELACPTEKALLLAIDTTTDQLADLNGSASGEGIELSLVNPVDMVLDGDKLLVLSAGCFAAADGGSQRTGFGIEEVTPSTGATAVALSPSDPDFLSRLLHLGGSDALIDRFDATYAEHWSRWSIGSTSLGTDLSDVPNTPVADQQGSLWGVGFTTDDGGTTPTAVRYDLTTETATPVVSWTSSLGSAAGTALVR